jgi:hypothetical protein
MNDKKMTELDVQQALLDEQREANRLKRMEMGIAADDPHAKLVSWNTDQEAANKAIVEAKGEAREFPMRVPLHTEEVGALQAFVTAVAYREISDEPRKGERGSPKGKLRIQCLKDWNIVEATSAIRAHHLEAHGTVLDDMKRQAAMNEANELTQKIERSFVRQTVWRQVTQPTMRRLIGRLVEDVLAGGEAFLVEERSAAAQ